MSSNLTIKKKKNLRIAVMTAKLADCNMIETALDKAGFESYCTKPKLIDYLRLLKYHPQLIVIDITLPDFYNRRWIKLYKLLNPGSRIVVLSEFLDNNHINRTYASGVDKYLLKALIGPFDIKRLINSSMIR